MVLPPHEGLVDGGSKVEDVVADSQVVLQAERLQHHSIPDWERQPQLLIGVTWESRNTSFSQLLIKTLVKAHNVS